MGQNGGAHNGGVLAEDSICAGCPEVQVRGQVYLVVIAGAYERISDDLIQTQTAAAGALSDAHTAAPG